MFCGFISFVIFAGQRPVPMNDPLFYLQLQSYKLDQDLEIYRDSYPFISKAKGWEHYSLNDSDVNLRLLPQALFSANSTDHQFSIWGNATWYKVSVLVESRLVQGDHSLDYLGSAYERSGVSGRMNTAFIRIQDDRYTFQMGRAPVIWGATNTNSIIQSGMAPSYDHMNGQLMLGDFHIEVLAGQLGSEYLADGTRIKRLIAGHQVNWLSKGKSLLLGVGEQIIYTGQNRSLELYYINPFVPYVFTAFEKDEENISSGDNDNSIIFMYGRYNLKPNWSLYAEMLIDDYQLDNTGRQHALGLNMGLDWGTKIFNRITTGTISYTRINSWTYIHSGQFTNWENSNHPIGYYYGPDAESFGFQIEHWLSSAWLIKLNYHYVVKGSNLLSSAWGNNATDDEGFPMRPVQYYHFGEYSLSRFMKYGILEAGWKNMPYANEVAYDGQNFTNYGLYIKYQLVWCLGFDLE